MPSKFFKLNLGTYNVVMLLSAFILQFNLFSVSERYLVHQKEKFVFSLQKLDEISNYEILAYSVYFVYFAMNMGTVLNTHYSKTNRMTKDG